MHNSMRIIMRGVLWAMPIAAFFAFVSPAFAAYLSPSGPVYPGASYSVNEDVGNPSGSTVTVTNDWFYKVNGGGWNSWCHQMHTVPAGGTITVSCGSTGDVAGTVMEFQVNTWRPDYSGTVSWSNTGFTVQAPAGVPSASLSPTGDVYPGTTLSLSGSVSGSGYTGANCWAYSVNGGARSCWFSPGAGTGNFSYDWSAGSADPNSTYTFYLCTDNGAGACAAAGSLRVVDKPSYTLSLQKVGSGSVSGSGISCGTGCTTTSAPYQENTTVTLTAVPSSGWTAGTSDWSGCDSTGLNQGGQPLCTVRMSADRSASIAFRQLVTSASFVNPTDGSSVNYKGSTYLQWTSTNTTGCSISASPALPGFPKTGLSPSHTGTNYYVSGLTQNETFSLTCTVVSGASGTAAATSVLKVNPAPTAACTMYVGNTINYTTAFGVPSWGVTAGGNTSNCPSAYFTNLHVSAIAALDSPGGPTPLRVFDFDAPGTGGGGTYLPWGAGVNCDYVTRMQEDGASALQNSGTVAKACSGGGTFLRATGSLGLERDFPTSSGGASSFPTTGYINTDPFRAGFDLFYAGALPWGNYNFHIDSTFSGIYKCPDGDVPFSISVPLTLCDYEPTDTTSDSRYFDSQCVPLNPNRASVPLNCPSLPISVSVQPTGPVITPSALDFTHLLQVQSKMDGAYEPGVAIAQVGDAVALDKNGVPLSPKEIIRPSSTGEGTDFSGTTQYEKHAARNFKVTLEAPKDRANPSGGFVEWKGCDSLSPNGRQCTVSFVFDQSGGKTKTVTANYTAKLDAPVITTNTAQCDAAGGKVNVYLQSAVSGASGYKLYRRSASTAASLIKDFSAANAPFSGNPYTDNTGTPNTTYYYTMTAYNASANSPASLEISRAASLPCPDLIVEPGSVQIIDTASPPNVLDPTAVPSGTSIKFRAKIRNQNGATSQQFDNEFKLDNNGTFPYTSTDFLSGLGAGLLSPFVTSAAIPSVSIGSHSLQVCADMPPPKPGTIPEANTAGNAEDNNCLTSPFSFTVVAPITVQLQCEQAGGTFKNDYCVIDYANTSKLRWTVTGSPSTCAGKTGTDLTGAVTPQSYEVSGNPFSLSNLLGKLRFNYQLECTR